MKRFAAALRSPEETHALGLCLGEYLPHDAVCLLRGDLAAGKTTLVKAICAYYGVPAHAVTSPTYTIANWYEGRLTVCHVDFYRLEGPEDVYNLDGEDWLNADGPTFIEWPDIASRFLKGVETLDIALSMGDADGQRRVDISARSGAYDAVFSALESLGEAGSLAVVPPSPSTRRGAPC